MTYKESYMRFDTLAELMKEAERDMNIARFVNPDRIKAIKKALEEVIKIKFKEEKQ